MVSIPESSASESSPPPEISESRTNNNGPSSGARMRALTPRQERRLIEYVEDMFLDIMRNYKKRDHPSTTLPTLHSYLCVTRTLLSIILQIPPVAPNQAALRIALLLRFTSETLSAISHYPHPIFSGSSSRRLGVAGQREVGAGGAETLRELLEWLDELDRGWHAVLCAQAWEPEVGKGVDIYIDANENHPSTRNTSDESNGSSNLGQNSYTQKQRGDDEDYSPASLGSTTTTLSQTDRARLRSLLVSGSSALEEWLECVEAPPSTARHRANGSGSQSNGGLDLGIGTNRPNGPETEDLETTLEQLGLQQAFNDLFSRTLTSMGELGGEVFSAGEELEMV